MANKGILVVISGPSGVGKGTIIRELLKRNDRLRFSVSATTRAPREGEIDGEVYHFVSRDEFLKMIDGGMLLEYAEYSGNYYGTPAEPVDRLIDKGFSVVMDIEVQGAMQVMEKRPDATFIFIKPPSIETLEERLCARNTETEESIRRRMETSVREMTYIGKYKYIIENDVLEEAVEAVSRAILSEENK